MRPISEGGAIAQRLVPDDLDESFEIGFENRAGILDEDRKRRVDDVGRRQTEMDEAGCFADCFAGCAQEGDDIVVGLALDLLHALQIASGAADRFDRPIGDAATTIPGFADGKLDAQPDLQLVIVTPHRPHFGPGVPADHELDVLSE